MAHVDAIGAARALHRPLAHREDDPVALAERHHLGARLHARPLLGQHELAAGEVASGLGEQDRDLERKEMLSVDVLMQAIVVARAIAQQKRRRPRLTRLMATGPERLVLGGVADVDAHRRVPAVGERREPPIKAAAQPDDQVRQRVGEIFVLAPAEAMGSPSRCASGRARRRHTAPQARGTSRAKSASARRRSRTRRARARAPASRGRRARATPSSGPSGHLLPPAGEG